MSLTNTVVLDSVFSFKSLNIIIIDRRFEFDSIITILDNNNTVQGENDTSIKGCMTIIKDNKTRQNIHKSC